MSTLEETSIDRRLILATALVIPAIAFAAQNHMDRSKHKPAGVSGLESDVVAGALPDSDRAHAVSGMGVYRRKNGTTCGLYVGVSPLTGRDDKESGNMVLLDNGDSLTDIFGDDLKKKVKGACGDGWTAEGMSKQGDYYVRGITVCTDQGDTSDRTVQGMRVWYSKLKENGTLEKDTNAEVWTSPTCGKWYDRAACDPGWLAVGVKAHVSNHHFRGVGLKCAEFKPGTN